MRIGSEYSYRFGKETIRAINNGDLYTEVIELLASLRMPVVKKGTGRHLQQHFLSRGRGWSKEEPANPEEKKGMRFDLFKNRIAVEVNSSVDVHLYKDILKFTVASNLDLVSAGIEIVWDEECAKASMEKFDAATPTVRLVERRLQPFRSIISCPIWVIGLASDD